MVSSHRQVKIKCDFCNKLFLRRLHHVKESVKLGLNSYCSKKCQYKSKIKGRSLLCNNEYCKKEFYKTLHEISKTNYCSRSCATIVNNQKYPKWPKRYCTKCRKEFKNRESKYCSRECGRSALYNNRGHIATKYIFKEIREEIEKISKKLGRTPSRRELGNMSYAAIRIFGSWNNAITTVGLIPHRSHDHRMYKRSRTKAIDGHLCDSVSEATIDNWLHRNKIQHNRNVSYPNTNHLADWAISSNKIFIEYFGLAKDSPRYDRSIKQKQKICQKNNIKLISIYPKDLYPKNHLDELWSKGTASSGYKHIRHQQDK